MDFIARAGSVLDKTSRLAGILLVLLIAETVLLFNYIGTNKELLLEYKQLRNQRDVYVVPGSTAGVYAPTQDEMLSRAFTSLIVQSLNTYTYENFELQYNEVKRFFDPKMLVYADKQYKRDIKMARLDARSTNFVPNRGTFKIVEAKDKYDKPTGDKEISVEGLLHQILGGNVVEAVPISITLSLKKVLITKTNPFGFILTQYRVTEIGKK